MKAIIFDNFGPSSVLKIAEVDSPKPATNEVLIKISHTSVNPVDWKIREGYLQQRVPHRLPIIPGWDASGKIIAVGDNVKSLVVGDEVYAYTRLPEVHSGTYAEMIALPESSVAKKPQTLDLATAASVPLAALTAYQALHEILKVKANDKVLIIGGAGGVGSFAIQFAKIAGAEVTSTSSAANLDYLKELGATHAVDYHKETLSDAAKRIAPDGFDVVFDAVGGSTLAEAMALVKSDDRIVSIVEHPKRGRYHFVYPNGTQLAEIAKLFDSGQLRAPAIQVRSIKEAAQAQDENAKRHVRGKVVLKIDF